MPSRNQSWHDQITIGTGSEGQREFQASPLDSLVIDGGRESFRPLSALLVGAQLPGQGNLPKQ